MTRSLPRILPRSVTHNARPLALFALLLVSPLGATGCEDTAPAAPAGPGVGGPGFPTEDSGGNPWAGDEPDTGAPGDDAESDGDSGPATACTPGVACSDGDPCTVDDDCVAGACVGTPVVCDDGVPCTNDACVQGVCTHALSPGFCRIDGTCWSDGQPNPVDPCRRCDSDAAPTAWTGSSAQGPCDDGDPCTVNDTCDALGCKGEPITCPGSANPCAVSACVEGLCQDTPVADGAPCDDGQDCTSNDVCTGGVCAGEGTICPDDGNPCTAEICQGTTCITEILNGEPCEDGDPCTAGDACLGNTCVSGPPKDADSDGEVDAACGGLDCDDTTGLAKPGLTETCGDGLDNDCDGATDDVDTDCGGGGAGAPPAGTPCTYQTDCYPERVCAYWAGASSPVCSDVCAGATDCPGATDICTKLPGSAQVAFCQPGLPGGALDGAPCTDDLECQSGMCFDGTCRPVCLDELHCPGATNTCAMVGDLSIGVISAACGPNAPGKLSTGQACLDGVDYNGFPCASGHCDLLPYPAPAWYCAPLCSRNSDCPGSQVCDVVMYATVPNAQHVPYDPGFESVTYDAVTGCYTSGATGTQGLGTECALNSNCASGKCLPLLPEDPTRWCTTYCVTDGDCPSGMQCKLDATNMASEWLQDPWISQGANANVWSYVRLCKWE